MKLTVGVTLAALAVTTVLAGPAMAEHNEAKSSAEPVGRFMTVAEAAAGTGAASGGLQVDDHLFDGVEKFASKAKTVNEVNLDRDSLALAGQAGGEQVAALAKKLHYVVIRNYEFAHEGDYNMADVNAILAKLDGNGWKHIVRNREEHEENDIAVRYSADGSLKETVIINAEPRELNLIHLVGNVNVSDLKSLGSIMKGAANGQLNGGDSTGSAGGKTKAKPGGGGEARSSGTPGDTVPVEGAPDGSGAASVGRQPKS